MKKSRFVILGALFVMAVASCSSGDNNGGWTYGAGPNGQKRDTFKNGAHYRYYGGGWYPVYNNGMIYPGAYGRGYSYGEMSAPGFKATPASAVPAYHSGSTSGRSSFGGFGSSAHSSVGS